jgi:hypothetical protein
LLSSETHGTQLVCFATPYVQYPDAALFTPPKASRDLEKKMWGAYLEGVLALLGRHEVIQVRQVHGKSILLTRRGALLHLHMGIPPCQSQ